MKRNKKFGLNTITDLKVFLLFLLDNIRYPVDSDTITSIVAENTDDISLDYQQCLGELVDSEHLLFDEIEGVRYYMISDKGREVASELYDTLDQNIREKSIRVASKHIAFTENGTSTKTKIEEADNNRFRVTVEAHSRLGKIMSVSMLVPSRAEAEEIAERYENRPDAVYRGVMFALTGRLELID